MSAISQSPLQAYQGNGLKRVLASAGPFSSIAVHITGTIPCGDGSGDSNEIDKTITLSRTAGTPGENQFRLSQGPCDKCITIDGGPWGLDWNQPSVCAGDVDGEGNPTPIDFIAAIGITIAADESNDCKLQLDFGMSGIDTFGESFTGLDVGPGSDSKTITIGGRSYTIAVTIS